MKGRPGLRSLFTFVSLFSAALGATAACDEDTSARIPEDAGGVIVADGAADTATSADAPADRGPDGTSGACPPLKGTPVPITTCSKTFGNGNDRMLPGGVATDPDGSIVVTGSFQGTVDLGGGVVTSAGEGDAFLLKLDSVCNHVWSKRFGSGSQDVGIAVATTGSGDIVAVIQASGSIDLGGGALPATADGQTDIVVARFDHCGGLRWARRFGGVGSQVVRALSVDRDGNTLLGGEFRAPLDFGNGPLALGTNGADIFLAKLDAAGVAVWSRSFGSTESLSRATQASSIVVKDDNALVVSGIGQLTIDFGTGPVDFPSSADGSGMWLAGSTSAGAVQGVRAFNNANAVLARSSDGSLFAAGNLDAVVDLGTGPMVVDGGAAHHTSFVAKVASADLSTIWARGVGSSTPRTTFSSSGIAATTTEVGLSGTCFGAVDYGGGTPCADREQLFVRYGVDGAFHSVQSHPRGPVAVAPNEQFIVAGAKGDGPGTPERMTVSKLSP